MTRSRILSWIRLLALIAVVLLVLRGDQAARAWMARRSAFFIDLGELRVVSSAAWLTPSDLQGIQDDSGLAGQSASLFTPDLCRRVREAYMRSPWIRRVAGVRRRYPNRLHAYVEVKKPVAGVLVGGNRIALLDKDGRRLPGLRDRPPEGLGYPLLRLYGVEAPLPEPGAVWSREVTEGIAVVMSLLEMEEEMATAAQIIGVDVTNVGGRRSVNEPEIDLVTAGGTTIVWGRSSASPLGMLDPPVDAKLKHLRRALLLYVGLRGVETVKLQFDELYVFEEGLEVFGERPGRTDLDARR